MLKALQKKETLVANKQYWDEQKKFREHQKAQFKEQDMNAPYKFEVLQKMFRNNDLRLPSNNSKVTRESVMAELNSPERDSKLTESQKADDYKPPSRMQIDRKKVKYEILKQIEHNKFKK